MPIYPVQGNIKQMKRASGRLAAHQLPKKTALGVLILISHRQLSSIESIYTTQSTACQTIRNWYPSSMEQINHYSYQNGESSFSLNSS